jgi:hypothetical protein
VQPTVEGEQSTVGRVQSTVEGYCCIYPCAGQRHWNVVAVAIGIAGATQLRCASVEATQLDMGIGSAPEGANLETSAEALESGNGPTGIKALYIAL